MAREKTSTHPPIVVIFGDEPFQKSLTLQRALDGLLPPDVDRALALVEYDGARAEDQGGPTLSAVMDDLGTLPFLAPRRVVLIREAERFISSFREKLESYVAAPAPTSTLILECRSFPKTTRLYKAAAASGAVHECRRLSGRALLEFVSAAAQSRGKRIDAPTAQMLVDRVGPDQGVLDCELEKLALYLDQRPQITAKDLDELVGLSREEKIFAVMDAAAAGDREAALALWNQVTQTDSAAPFKAVGGVAFVLRKWLAARRMLREGLSIAAIAPKVLMWGRERELQTLLATQSESRLAGSLCRLAQLDAQAKVGARSIENGIEALILEVAAR